MFCTLSKSAIIGIHQNFCDTRMKFQDVIKWMKVSAFVDAKLPPCIRGFLAFLMEDASAAKFTDYADKICSARFKGKIAVTVPFATLANSPWRIKNVNQLTSHMNALLKRAPQRYSPSCSGPLRRLPPLSFSRYFCRRHQYFGKRPRDISPQVTSKKSMEQTQKQSVISTAVSGSETGRLFCIFDRSSFVWFLTDTSAEKSGSVSSDKHHLHSSTLIVKPTNSSSTKGKNCAKTSHIWSRYKAMFHLGFGVCGRPSPDRWNWHISRFWPSGWCESTFCQAALDLCKHTAAMPKSHLFDLVRWCCNHHFLLFRNKSLRYGTTDIPTRTPHDVQHQFVTKLSVINTLTQPIARETFSSEGRIRTHTESANILKIQHPIFNITPNNLKEQGRLAPVCWLPATTSATYNWSSPDPTYSRLLQQPIE